MWEGTETTEYGVKVKNKCELIGDYVTEWAVVFVPLGSFDVLVLSSKLGALKWM